MNSLAYLADLNETQEGMKYLHNIIIINIMYKMYKGVNRYKVL